MADTIEQRDFFISFNSADLAYAEAIDAALRAEGFTTFYYPNDLRPGGSIPEWMDEALMNSAQTLALYSPDYIKQGAAYSRAEHHASWWQDPGNDKRKLIPVIIRETTFTPLISVLSRIEVIGTTPDEAATQVVRKLKTPAESKERDHWRTGLPLPRIFKAIYLPNPNFTGRFEAMESLQKSLRAGNAAITAVEGMGGVGKTTLAAEYCHRFGSRYGGVWWVRAEQESVLLGDLVELGQRLKLDLTGNIETDARATLDHLAARTEPWLVVYDNAPHPDGVSKWLPVGAVRCIITSRFAGFGGIAKVTSLDQWADQVTADYLLARTQRDDKAGALRLARALGGLPLAAEQAAVFLKDRAGIGFDDYAREVARLIKEERPAGAKGAYPDTVYAAFVKSLETLDGLKGGKIGIDLLHLCAFFSPDGVDLGLLTSDRDGTSLSTDFATAMANTFAREDALAALSSLSLLRKENGPMGPILIFHRLLLDVVRDRMAPDSYARWCNAAVNLVASVFPPEVVKATSSWPVCARLMPHIRPLDTYAEHEGGRGKALDYILNQGALYLSTRGDHAGALALINRSVSLARDTATEAPLGLAVSLGNLASSYTELGRLDEAEAAYREALALKEPRLDPNDPALAITLSNLAEVYRRRGDFAKAEPIYLRVLDVNRKVYGPDSAEVGLCLSNLGALYGSWAADKPDQTEQRKQEKEYKKQALAVTRAARGVRHPETAIQYNNLAVMKTTINDWEGATGDVKRAFAIMLSLDLAQHPDTQDMARGLVAILERRGHSEEAKKLMSGDLSDLLPMIAEIEAEQRAWANQDPKRHFGPPSPFGPSRDDIRKIRDVLAAAGVDVNELARRVRSGELSEAAFSKVIADAIARLRQ